MSLAVWSQANTDVFVCAELVTRAARFGSCRPSVERLLASLVTGLRISPSMTFVQEDNRWLLRGLQN